MLKSNRPSKKHQPRGLPILHEDKDIIVVVKRSGLLTVGTSREKSRTAHYLLNDYVRKGKSEQAKKFLQENWSTTEKHYLAIVYGQLTPREGMISTYLAENKAQKVYSTLDGAKGKLSHTAYKVLKESKGFSLVDIHLLTGRKHQIRVHFAEKDHPVVGDTKYGKGKVGLNRLALHARSISFTHPFSGKQMTFDIEMPEDFLRLFGERKRKKKKRV